MELRAKKLKKLKRVRRAKGQRSEEELEEKRECLSQDGLRLNPRSIRREHSQKRQRVQRVGEVSADEVEEEVGRNVKKKSGNEWRRRLYRPAQDKVGQHKRGHFPFQPWCEQCVS